MCLRRTGGAVRNKNIDSFSLSARTTDSTDTNNNDINNNIIITNNNIRNNIRNMDDDPTNHGTSHNSINIDSLFSKCSMKDVHYWILPGEVSQSRLGGRRTPSSACTLITLAIASCFASNKLRLPRLSPMNSSASSESPTSHSGIILPQYLIDLLLNAIIDGNEDHEKAMKKRRESQRGSPDFDTFTVPQAMESMKTNLHEVDFRTARGNPEELLIIHLKSAMRSPLIKHLNCLYFVLIVDERATCMILDRSNETLAIFDSHSHFRGTFGAIVIMAGEENLEAFARSVCRILFPEHRHKKSMLFEISCLQYIGITKGEEALNAAAPYPITGPVFARSARFWMKWNDLR